MIVSSLAPSAWPAVSDEQLSREILKSVANAGHLVEKETVMHSVWKGTFVEERSLAHSISVSRKILGDGTERNRYIETVPRHGYRFIAPIELHEKTLPKKQVRDRQRCIPLRCCRSCFASRIQKYSKSFVLSRFDIPLFPVQSV
jgi:hypothetical protein